MSVRSYIIYPVSLCVFFIALLISDASASSDDSFIAGYATAVLEREFNLKVPSLSVTDGIIVLYEEDIKGAEHDKVISVLSGINGVIMVRVIKHEESSTAGTSEIAQPSSAPTRAIPFRKLLFEPLIADPRWPHFSATYQYYLNNKELKNVGSTSFGETFSFYTGHAPFGGRWQFGIQAAVFAIFDLDAESKDLINADYWVGIPLSYRTGNFSALFRIFHQSSHLGDEYLLRNRLDRVNLSYESVDMKISYDINGWFRTYAGGGFILHKEPSDLLPWSTQFGLEFKSRRKYLGDRIRPVAGVDLKNWEENNWKGDLSARFGVQIESKKTVGHKVQLLFEYFKGHSPNGQFYERSIEYLGFGTHFYF
ncbi:MAG: DUF1207 domain-containing protein [Nitrospirota bacterium]